MSCFQQSKQIKVLMRVRVENTESISIPEVYMVGIIKSRKDCTLLI